MGYRTLLPILVTLLTLCAAGSAAGADNARGITVHGEGRVRASPDEAHITLAIQARAASLERARADVTARTRAVLEHLATLALADSDISAAALTLRPEYRWDKDTGSQVLRGYRVERRIDVRLRDLERLGELLEGAADAGANDISPPTLGHSREAELRREALRAAARDARANAEAIAQGLALEVGALRSIAQRALPGPRPVARERAMVAAEASPGADSYRTGDIVFESRLEATFSLRGAAQAEDEPP